MLADGETKVLFDEPSRRARHVGELVIAAARALVTRAIADGLLERP